MTLSPGYTINTKGGCVEDDFIEWIEKCVVPAYPNVASEWEYDESGPSIVHRKCF